MSSDAILELQEDFFRQTVEWAEMEKEMEFEREMAESFNDPQLDLKCQEMRMGENRY